jgi:hypothetical protein
VSDIVEIKACEVCGSTSLRGDYKERRRGRLERTELALVQDGAEVVVLNNNDCSSMNDKLRSTNDLVEMLNMGEDVRTPPILPIPKSHNHCAEPLV